MAMLAVHSEFVNIRSRRLDFVSLILSVMLFGSLGTAAAANEFDSDPPHRSNHRFEFDPSGFPSENSKRERGPQDITIENGFVIWNGEYISPPYTLSGEGDQIYVNGELVPVVQSPIRPASFGGPRGGRFGPMNHRGMLRHALDANGLLIVGSDNSLTIRPEFTGRFLETLLSDQENNAKFVELANQMNGSGLPQDINWASLVGAFVPNQELQDRYTSIFSTPETAAVEDPAVSASIAKRTIRYAMTVAGMILGVFGFGMLMQHQPHARSAHGKIDNDGAGFQLLPLYVSLVFLFGMFDLGCTLFANETGGLLELNPLGNRLLNNPMSMMLSKISVTALSATILVRLRKYRIAQIAAWWLCLVCVFLTLRWVTFTSMFLS